MDEGVLHAGVLNMARMWETPARTLGGRWTRWDDAWAADSALPTRLLNRVTVIRPLASSSAAGDLARRAADFYASRPDGREFLVNDPWATLDLEPYGFRRWWSLPLMIRPQQESPRRFADLEVREARSRAELATFVRVLAEGFGLPVLESVPSSQVLDSPALAEGAMRCWVGLLDGLAVGTSAAYVSDGVVGVYLVSVLPAMRGRGFGEALSWQATLAAQAPATLQASEMGRPVYERMGYVTTLTCRTWIKETRDAG